MTQRGLTLAALASTLEVDSIRFNGSAEHVWCVDANPERKGRRRAARRTLMARRIAIDIPPEDRDVRRKRGAAPGGPGRDRRGPPRGGPRKDKPEKKHRTDPKVRARAEELHDNGMPFQMAMAVALGRLSLNDALERLQRQERVEKLMEEHELSRALATQIVIGHASLDVVLSRRRMQAHREENRLRSCLDDAKDTGRPLALALHGKDKAMGIVLEVAPYSVTIQEDGAEEPREIHKLQLKYAWDPEEWKKVRKGVRTDKDLSKAPVEPIERPQDRYTCSDKRLFRYMDDEAQVQATLLEGEVLKGTVTWFGRYEFGMMLKSDVEVTIFRHALHDLTDG